MVPIAQAEDLRAKSSGDFTVLVDPYAGNARWCDAVIKAAASANSRNPANLQHIPGREEVMGRIRDARRQGQVPVIVETEGSAEEIQGFLNGAGIAGVEFIP